MRLPGSGSNFGLFKKFENIKEDDKYDKVAPPKKGKNGRRMRESDRMVSESSWLGYIKDWRFHSSTYFTGSFHESDSRVLQLVTHSKISSINQPITQPINQSINRSIDQSIQLSHQVTPLP